MAEHKKVFEAITSDVAAIEAAAKISATWESAQEYFLALLKGQLKGLLPAEWLIEGKLDKRKQSKISMAPLGIDHKFVVIFDSANYGNFCFGVELNRSSLQRAREISENIKQSTFGTAEGPATQWAWWRYTAENDTDVPVQSHWGQAAAPWTLIHAGTLAEAIIRTAQNMIAVTQKSA